MRIDETDKPNCLLCKAPSSYGTTSNKRTYFKCSNCACMYLKENDRLNEKDERKRYLEHNNDVTDKRYQKFVSPITDYIIKKYTLESLGLDYGAGTGPVISSMLNEKGFNLNIYDPYFHNNKKHLEQEYDYIVCCEVIEHFYKPKNEFQQLKNLLKKGGELICKTDLYGDDIDFNNWYYKNDPTHVFFYSKQTFQWIKQHIGFNKVSIEGRLIILEK